jgi:hypothetical protein
MSIRNRTSALAFGLVFAAVVASGTIALPAQEPAPGNSTGPVKSPATKRVVDPSRRVPSFFGQIGLTAEQKEAIYKVRGKHQQKIDDLEKQVATIQAEMLAECTSLLTEPQKKMLDYRREASVKAKQAKAAAKAKAPAAEPSAATKPSDKSEK